MVFFVARTFKFHKLRRELVHPADVATAEQFGWPVPSSEAWPTVYYIEKGTPRALTTEEHVSSG